MQGAHRKCSTEVLGMQGGHWKFSMGMVAGKIGFYSFYEQVLYLRMACGMLFTCSVRWGILCRG